MIELFFYAVQICLFLMPLLSINEDECIYRSEYLSEYSSMLGIRVSVPHLTKFDVGGVGRWKWFVIGGLH